MKVTSSSSTTVQSDAARKVLKDKHQAKNGQHDLFIYLFYFISLLLFFKKNLREELSYRHPG